MLLDWVMHTSLIQKRLPRSYQSKCYMCFYGFLWLRITIVALVLRLIWYYSTSWVSIIGDLVTVLIFWFRIIKCGWFFMLGIITSNILKIGNGWAIVVKCATIAAYVGTHFFFSSFRKLNFRKLILIVMHRITEFPRKTRTN